MCEMRDWLTVGREPGWLHWAEGNFLLYTFHAFGILNLLQILNKKIKTARPSFISFKACCYRIALEH